jgi:hypothetical protein
MAVSEFLEKLGATEKLSSILWLRNPDKVVRAIYIEPWGSVIYLLPGRDYAIVAESKEDHEPTGTSIDLGEALTIWPEGTSCNRIHRADGSVVWDDADPSQVYPLLVEPIVSIAQQHVAHTQSPTLDSLRQVLLRDVSPERIARSDLPELLVEHGLLGMDTTGSLLATCATG